jgi:cobyrinic acid a,c-diamide synthase
VLPIPRLVIAGTHTGVGKTTVTLGLMRALRRRGMRVQGFKTGPDFIDPSHHARATGRPSRNLDTWMCPEPVVRALFAHGAADADIAIIEGMMGLFDGSGAGDERGSTAHLAKLLLAPVILVIDAWSLARSAGAMALGFQTFDPALHIAGVILNNVAGQGHLDFVAPAILNRTGIPVLGWLAKDHEIAVDERHLGLVTAEAWQKSEGWYDRIADRLEARVPLEPLLALARSASPLPPADGHPFAPAGAPPGPAVTVGIARDEAFSFYYEDNLDLLRAAGATIVPFSPLRDARLPEVDLLYFGGGFPELFCSQLAENRTMLDDLRAFIARDRPVYAECGGLMYLGESITTFDGKTMPMAGVLPVATSMLERKLALGYVEVTAEQDTVLTPAGAMFRGHEFHYSSLTTNSRVVHAYRRTRGDGSSMPPDGFVRRNVLASYTHAHFGSNARLPFHLLAAARRTSSG